MPTKCPPRIDPQLGRAMRLLALALGIVFGFPSVALSQVQVTWLSNPAGPTWIADVDTEADPAGGFVVAFNEYCCRYDSQVSVQRVRPDGTLRYSPHGQQVHQHSAIAFGLRIPVWVANDGNEGVFALVTDMLDYTRQYARLIHLHGDGTQIARSVGSSGFGDYSHALDLESDGRGGTGALWKRWSAPYLEIFLSAFDPADSTRFPDALITSAADAGDFKLLATDAGFLVLWRESTALKARSLDLDDGTGGEITIADSVSHFHATSDGAGGAFISWISQDGIESGTYCQKRDAAGLVEWTSELSSTSLTAHPSEVRVASDESGGAFVVRAQAGTGDAPRLHVQHLLADGNEAWPSGGVSVAGSVSVSRLPDLVADGLGGAFVSWENEGAGPFYRKVLAQQIDPGGASRWPEGVEIGDAYYPAGTRLFKSSPGAAFVLFTGTEVGMARIDSTLHMPILTASIEANDLTVGSQVEVRWAVEAPDTDARVQIRVISANHPDENLGDDLPSSGSVSWTATPPIATPRWVQVVARTPDGAVASRTLGPFLVRDLGPGLITFSAPDSGDTVTIGTIQQVRWTASDPDGIDIQNLYVSRWTPWGADEDLLTSMQTPTTSFDWAVSGPETFSAVFRLEIRDNVGVTTMVVSPPFVIRASTDPLPAAQVEVLAPVAPDTLREGYLTTIRWQQTGRAIPSPSVEVAISRAGQAGPYDVIRTLAQPTSPEFRWLVSGPADSAVVRVRIREEFSSEFVEGRSAPFVIRSAPQVRVLAPRPGDVFHADSVCVVHWAFSDSLLLQIAAVEVAFSRTGAGGPFRTIGYDLLPHDSLSWRVPDEPTTNAFLRIEARDYEGPVASVLMEHSFTIIGRPPPALPASLALELIANPAAGEAQFALALPSATSLRLEILDVTGRVVDVVADGSRNAGRHVLAWAGAAKPGIYFARLRTPRYIHTRRFALLR